MPWPLTFRLSAFLFWLPFVAAWFLFEQVIEYRRVRRAGVPTTFRRFLWVRFRPPPWPKNHDSAS
jgi:hypothetical protein